MVTNAELKYLKNEIFVNGRNPINGTDVNNPLQTSETKNASVEIETAPTFDLNAVEMNIEREV